jgi:hypothetical protein
MRRVNTPVRQLLLIRTVNAEQASPRLPSLRLLVFL